MRVLHINTGSGEDGSAPARLEAPRDAAVAERPVPEAPGSALVPLAEAAGATARALPGLARIGAVTVLHTAGWGATAYARACGRLARAVVDPGEAARITRDLSDATGRLTRAAREVAGGPAPTTALALQRWGLPMLERMHESLEARAGSTPTPEQSLRRSGEELLRRSRDVWDCERGHPAYAGILAELAPDEARVVVLLLRDGPQPSVDVRRGGPVGRLNGSPTIARGLTMIGARASVRYPASVPQYLNNLTRLGLVWQSPEPVADLQRYQVVEAQPDVLAAVHSVRKARIIRRSIHLTAFGQDFARTCFADADELAVLPEHTSPPEAAVAETRVEQPDL